ncbi:MAG: hypothetical protein ABW044_04190, partial [Cellvibrio sp.]
MLGALPTQSFKGLFIFTLIFALTACGGGGGGGGGKTESSSSTPSLTANAGADKTVNAGDRIDLKSNILVVGGTGFRLANGNLEVEGASSTAKDIVFASWTKTEGPAIALGSSGTTAAEAYFTAPSTGTAASIKITYKLTLKTADGTTAEDSVTFTVNRVNAAPTANAGPDTSADSSTTVTLKGAGTDADGTIAGYSWVQQSGETVQISGNSTTEASFVAPEVSSETNLEFTLTVTDNEGAKSTDNLVVLITPGNAPRVKMHFPPVGGIYKESTISAFGTVIAKTGTITSLKVSIGNTAVDALVDSAGNWRANNVAIPSSVDDVAIHAVATDSNGNTGKAISNLKTSEENSFDDIGLGSFIGLAVDSSKKMAYVLADGNDAANINLFAVDLTTGKKGAVISNFADSSKGLSIAALSTLTYSPEKQLIYVGSAPSGTNTSSRIISVDINTGMRSLVSGDGKGNGTPFDLPYGMAIGTNNVLYVADNKANVIFAVNTETGDRITAADSNTALYGINAPLLLALDKTQGSERLFVLANAQINYILQIDPPSSVFTTLVTDSQNSSQGPELRSSALGFAVDPKSNMLFVAENFGGVIKVDVATGNREKLMDSSPFRTKITYDPQHHLLYLL